MRRRGVDGNRGKETFFLHIIKRLERWKRDLPQLRIAPLSLTHSTCFALTSNSTRLRTPGRKCYGGTLQAKQCRSGRQERRGCKAHYLPHHRDLFRCLGSSCVHLFQHECSYSSMRLLHGKSCCPILLLTESHVTRLTEFYHQLP